MNNDLNTPALQWLATHTANELIQVLKESLVPPVDEKATVSLSRASELTKLSFKVIRKKFQPAVKGSGRKQSEYWLKDIQPHIKLQVA